MIELFNEKPLLVQISPNVNHTILIGLNRIGQLLVLISFIVPFIQDFLQFFLKNGLQKLVNFIRQLAYIISFRESKNSWGLTFPPEDEYEEFLLNENKNLFSKFFVSTVYLFLIMWITGGGPIDWIFPIFSHLWELLVISWTSINWSFISVLLSFGKIFILLLSFMLYPVLILVVYSTVLRPYADLFEIFSKHISNKLFNILTLFMGVLGLTLIYIVS